MALKELHIQDMEKLLIYKQNKRYQMELWIYLAQNLKLYANYN